MVKKTLKSGFGALLNLIGVTLIMIPVERDF